MTGYRTVTGRTRLPRPALFRVQVKCALATRYVRRSPIFGRAGALAAAGELTGRAGWARPDAGLLAAASLVAGRRPRQAPAQMTATAVAAIKAM